jgi:hypothetical protein
VLIVFVKKHEKFKNVTIVTEISPGIQYTKITKEQITGKQNTKTISIFS